MPFVQPTGVAVGTRPNNVASIINSFNNPAPKSKPEAEKSCQVKNNWAKSADDSIHIFTKTWHPIGVSVHSVVVFIHDIVEHCERYQPLFALFAGKGIEVQSFDLPGFGETGARADALGITGGYDVLLKEIDNALDRALTSRPSKPIFLMGHGMGGALVLNYVCGLGRRISSLAGIMVSAPYLKPAISGAGTRFPSTYNRLGKWYPNISVNFQVSPQELTRDHAEQERHHGDGLIRDSVSLRCLGDMIYQGQKLLRKRWKQFPPALPTLILHGTDDPICSYKATSTLITLLQKLEPVNLKFKSWKGNKHDPHWDLDADAVRSEYIHWIRNISRNYVKPPLESEKVPTDTLKTAKPAASHVQPNKRIATTADHQSDKSPPNSKGKNSVKDKLPSTDELEPEPQQTLATTLSGASLAETEAIQDLAGLRRQQELKLQRVMEKRQEYNLLSNGEIATADTKAVSGSIAALRASAPDLAKSDADQQNPPTSTSSSTSSHSPPSDPDTSAKTEAREESSAAAASSSTSESMDDTTAGVIALTTTAGTDHSASAPNLADTTQSATIPLTTITEDLSASAPNLTVAAVPPGSSSTITAVPEKALESSGTAATVEVNTKETIPSAIEHHTETPDLSIADLNAAAVPVVTTTAITDATMTDATVAENTNIRGALE
ncbi:hypothetical protein BGZ68_002173 [Mortierella alpina]|nr:hypothetical protein BGZ68_002173 [Mortierella alpina]